MRIGDLAARSGVTTKTVRYYEQIGLLEPPRRASNGYRMYGEATRDRLALIRCLQWLGLHLGEIREIVAFADHGVAPSWRVQQLMVELPQRADARLAAASHRRCTRRAALGTPLEALPRHLRYRRGGATAGLSDGGRPGFARPDGAPAEP